MIGKKAVAIMWIMFFIFLVVLSASYIYFLDNKFSPETEIIGSLQLSLKDLIDEGNVLLFNIEKSARIASERGLKDLFAKGGLINACETVDGYGLLFSKEECYIDRKTINNNFIESFGIHFDKYLERLGGSITRYDYLYFINESYLSGLAREKIDFVRDGISYSVKPNFFIKLSYNPEKFIDILETIAAKKECLQRIEFNELADSDDKIAKECNFDDDYEWVIRKRNDYLLFDIKSKEELMFAGKIDFKFAIYLNSLNVMRDYLKGIKLNVVNL